MSLIRRRASDWWKPVEKQIGRIPDLNLMSVTTCRHFGE
jgi:hypothetical protein